MILLTHQKERSPFLNPSPIPWVCVSARTSLVVDDLYRGGGCLLQSNSHPKWPARGLVRREIMCLLWTLMIQRKQTNDPPWVSHRVQWLHHSHYMKSWERSAHGRPLSGEGHNEGRKRESRANEKEGEVFCLQVEAMHETHNECVAKKK